MNAVLAGSQGAWTTAASDEICLALEIILLKRTIVLSWSQFIFAEGSDDEVRLAFSSHDVIVRGRGLSALLAEVSTHRIAEVREPARADLFPGNAARFIREIEVRRVDVE